MYGAVALLPFALYMEGPVLLNVLRGGGTPARFFLMNGFFYYLNNQMNFLVLEKVDAVTLYNGVGITLALSGAYCYMKAKQVSARPAATPTSTPTSSPFVTARMQ